LSTRLAVCGGVYANPFALRAWIEDARAQGADRLICLGDLGGFGADCNGVWPLLTEHGVECVAGNYDIAIGRGDEDCGCGYADPRDNHFAQLMYDYTRAHTSPQFAAWMRGLPEELREDIEGLDVHAVHGSPLAVNDFLWESLDDDELRMRLALSGADVLLCTHTGIPWQRQVDGTLLVNTGTVGRPANDGRVETWYALVDLDDGGAHAELIPLSYPWREHAASMREAGLPDPFVETVETGWWTTCLEIVPAAERSRGRYHVYRDAMPAAFAAEGAGWADAPADDGGDRPVVPLFGSAVFPPRLWIYSNFHCNLACDYCAVASSPTAPRRSIGLDRFRALVDGAVAEGFEEIYVTGGEPFIEPDIVAMLAYASDRLETVCLTNAMLFLHGRRRRELEQLALRPRLTLQSSIDGAQPATHDVHRGEGSWQKAMEGIALARDLGLPVRVAMTETPENSGEAEPLRRVMHDIGVTGENFAVRPLVHRGFASGGMEVSEAVMVPELTITADGAHWHPVGGDLASSPDMVVARGEVTLREAKRLIVERFLELRQADGSLPAAFHCAV
jgi:predicted phosphodiesterase/pyruvate-formate lyase-activating enzyme